MKTSDWNNAAEDGWSLWEPYSDGTYHTHNHLIWRRDKADRAVLLPVSCGRDLDTNWMHNADVIGYIQ